MRLFLALKPDRPAEAVLAQQLLRIQDAAGATAPLLRWMPASNIHATLHFLGDVDAGRWRHLQEALGDSIAHDPFRVELGGVGVFPESRAPRVVWLDVITGTPEISAIHVEIGRRLTEAGFTIEIRPFSPHLTVARVPDRERARVKTLRERLKSVAAMPIGWIVDRVTLFQSDLSGSVPQYAAVHEIALAKPT